MRSLEEIDNDSSYIIGAMESNIDDLAANYLDLPQKFQPPVARLVALKNQLAANFREAAATSKALVNEARKKAWGSV